MRLILSRKGYDSASGGVPSPIFPDGGFCSLPIPQTWTTQYSEDRRPYLDDVLFRGRSVGPIAEQLTCRPDLAKITAHLDPDLDVNARPRMAGWRPSFGQVDAAQSHLANQGVGVGDLFLFFGWFREVELANGRLRYRADAPDLHCLFGWLQVGDVFHPAMGGSEPPAWAADHPHVRYSAYYGCETTNNTLYVASEKLRLPGLDRAIAGGGVFDHFAPRLQLTDTGQQRSTWRLPAAFYPTDGAPPLSYHSSMSRWTEAGDQVFLQLVARGQEFVLDCDFYPGVYAWLGEVFSEAPTTPVAPAD